MIENDEWKGKNQIFMWKCLIFKEQLFFLKNVNTMQPRKAYFLGQIWLMAH